MTNSRKELHFLLDSYIVHSKEIYRCCKLMFDYVTLLHCICDSLEKNRVKKKKNEHENDVKLKL